jgi:hypothetical protein
MPAPSSVPSWRVAAATISMLPEDGPLDCSRRRTRASKSEHGRAARTAGAECAIVCLPARSSWISLTRMLSRRSLARASRGVSASMTPAVVPPPET